MITYRIEYVDKGTNRQRMEMVPVSDSAEIIVETDFHKIGIIPAKYGNYNLSIRTIKRRIKMSNWFSKRFYRMWSEVPVGSLPQWVLIRIGRRHREMNLARIAQKGV